MQQRQPLSEKDPRSEPDTAHAAYLEARGWRHDPGLGWLDPAEASREASLHAPWSGEKALKIQRLRDTLATLYEAGWRVYGDAAPRALLRAPQLWDPCPRVEQQRVCGLSTAIERQMQREALSRGWPCPPETPDSLAPPTPLPAEDSPERFLDLSAARRMLVLLWVRSVMKPSSSPGCVTSLHLFRFCEDEVVFALSNGAMKGAMLTAGIAPVDRAAREARYRVRPLRSNVKGKKRSLCRTWGSCDEVYSILDASEALQARFLEARASALCAG